MTATNFEIARRAKALAEDDVVQEILGKLEARYIREWKTSQPADVAKRETCHASIRALEDFRAKLNAMAIAPRVDQFNNRTLKNKDK